jgi:hypothetical protein
MRVLVACEFSGIVRDAFAARGHDAWSCDLLPTERPGPHIEGDVLAQDLACFDLLIAHPPCTYLTVSGARWWTSRRAEQADAVAFCERLLAAPVARIALENPVGALSRRLRPPDQVVQPWMFGHAETKATCLWLKGLPRLRPDRLILDLRQDRVHREAPGPDRWKRRSRTLPGLARAMAQQWGGDWLPRREEAWI